MGVLAPSPPWIPEDDLLLKNAIEAGASLESLAKGAVCFSRRFTIRELQDRWYTLLYDIDTSMAASARIIEVEIEQSAANHSKSNSTHNPKRKEWICGKRKGDTVRSHYHTMRKRVCNEPCNVAELGFFAPPCVHVCNGSGSGPREQLKTHTEDLDRNGVVGTSISNLYGFTEVGFDTGQDAFPEIMKVASDAANSFATVHALHSGNVDSHKDDLLDGIVGRGCLQGFVENVPPISVDKAVGKSADQSFEHNGEQFKNISQIFCRSPTNVQNCSGIQEIRPPQTLQLNNQYETNDLDTKSLPPLSSGSEICVNLSSGSLENQHLSSEVTDCSVSFHNLSYLSPAPAMNVWEAIEDISTPPMQTDKNSDVKGCGVSAPLVKRTDSPVHNGAQSESKLHYEQRGAMSNNATAVSDGDFLDLSLNFENDEFLFIDVDEKDTMDRSCLDSINSILLSSPCDIHQDEVPNSGDPKAEAFLDPGNMISDGAHCGKPEDTGNQMHSGLVGEHNAGDLAATVPHTISKICSFSEPLEKFSSCTLNTEDLDVPDNSDSLKVTSLVTSPRKLISDEKKASRQDLTVPKDEEETSVQPSASSKKAAEALFPKVGLMHQSDCHKVKAELLQSDSLVGRHAIIASDDPSPCKSTPVAPVSGPVIALKNKVTTLDMGKHGDIDNTTNPVVHGLVEGSIYTKISSAKTAVSSEREADMHGTLHKSNLRHAELGSGEMEFVDPGPIISTSVQNEQFSDCEDDVPSFSDIEALILDMDLSPCDQELFNNEVPSYQHVDTKREIIRLEQGVSSCMHRAIVSHGAFAMLYGRYLKHYIKKPEVSLGRATEHVTVDIDLGREGRANKISRRQAIIKMDGDGSFSLQNIGKCAVLINGKEVQCGQHFSLTSGCLIEIKCMRFIFELNENSVRQHLAEVARKSHQIQSSKFNWSPGHEVKRE